MLWMHTVFFFNEVYSNLVILSTVVKSGDFYYKHEAQCWDYVLLLMQLHRTGGVQRFKLFWHFPLWQSAAVREIFIECREVQEPRGYCDKGKREQDVCFLPGQPASGCIMPFFRSARGLSVNSSRIYQTNRSTRFFAVPQNQAKNWNHPISVWAWYTSAASRPMERELVSSFDLLLVLV